MENIKNALSSGKNKFNTDISGIDEYINNLYNRLCRNPLNSVFTQKL